VIFNQFSFLFVFLPIILTLVFYLPTRKYRVELLFVGSVIFYGISGFEHAAVLLAGILCVYFFSARSSGKPTPVAFAISVVVPLLALIYYKYSGFIVGGILQLDDGSFEGSSTFSLFRSVVLPAGISFFTFQLISFSIDKFSGQIRSSTKFFEFALYISFFPQLVAGPILRFHQVEEAIKRLPQFIPSIDDITAAISFICFGLALKVLLADNLGVAIEPMVAEPAGLAALGAWFVVFSYSFQIYFDFFGYSLIAIGLGRLFGFAFPNNFLRPYEALNPRDFWRRWHVTLSYWIRDYLYLPLGGNRRYRINILIVFAIVGLWHGAGWSFVFWGLYHAALVILYRQMQPIWDFVPRLLQATITFTLVSLGWLFFVYDFGEAYVFLKSLFGAGNGSILNPTVAMWLLLLMSAAACFMGRYEQWAIMKTDRRLVSYSYTAALAALFVATLLFVSNSQPFIYFRF